MKYADQEATGNRSMCMSQKSMTIDTGPGVTEKWAATLLLITEENGGKKEAA